MNTHDIELPPLPEWMCNFQIPADDQDDSGFNWLDWRMKEYARAAIKAAHQPAEQKPAAHPAITHCDNCGCDWLDNGLNPIGCPYCKHPAPDVSELVEALEDIQKVAMLDNIRTGTHAAAVLGRISAICEVTLAAHRRHPT